MSNRSRAATHKHTHKRLARGSAARLKPKFGISRVLGRNFATNLQRAGRSQVAAASFSSPAPLFSLEKRCVISLALRGRNIQTHSSLARARSRNSLAGRLLRQARVSRSLSRSPGVTLICARELTARACALAAHNAHERLAERRNTEARARAGQIGKERQIERGHESCESQ